MNPTPESPYVNTPVSPEDEDAFVDGVQFATKAELYAAEEESIASYSAALFETILSGEVTTEDLVQFGMPQDIHFGCYGDIWQWAGRIRTVGLNLGSDPAYIRNDLMNELGNVRYWVDNKIGSAEWIAINSHHRMVKIHPFVDGNGRATRLYADAVLLSLTGDTVFKWSVNPAYFSGLREADLTMDAAPLLALITTQLII